MKSMIMSSGRRLTYRTGTERGVATSVGPLLCVTAQSRSSRHEAAGGAPLVAAAGRLRIARALDEGALRWLAKAAGAGGGARIELVFADGRRERIAQGAKEVNLRALVASGRNMDARLELVFRRAKGFRTPQ